MKKPLAVLLAVLAGAALGPGAFAPSVGDAGPACPLEVDQARELLSRKSQSALAGARMQDVQAPRVSGKDVQAPRVDSKEVQAPRSLAGGRTQDVQAPRVSGKDIQAPRSKDPQQFAGDVFKDRDMSNSPHAGVRLAEADIATRLVQEALAACKAGDMKTAKDKAEAAIVHLK